jgi:hypothetical protein
MRSIIIPTYRRPTTAITPFVPALASYTKIFLVHDEVDERAYWRAWAGRDDVLVQRTDVAPGPGGKLRQTEWWMARQPRGAWQMLADDDMLDVTAVEAGFYDLDELPTQRQRFVGSTVATTWRRLFESELVPDRLDAIVEESIARAEAEGAYLVGFATTKNPYFRARKWRTVGYVAGGLRLWRADPGFRFPRDIGMDDFAETAEHLRRYGAVVINNFVWGKFRYYVAGGHGRREDRLAQRRLDIAALDAAYPGLFRVEAGDYPDLRVRFTSPAQIERWRRSLPR